MLDPKLLRRLARVMSSEGVTKLSYKDPESGLELALERGHAAPVAAPGPVVMMSGPAPAAPMALPSAAPAAAGGAPEAGGALPPGVVAIESPMVGTFYRSPSPEAEPFVSAGSRITADSVICIVEAMKVMNEIKAELSGEVVEVLVENGEPVEYGQPLFLVKKA
ncbi:MAG: acetyl-CoA carboxylase biotin carboxyl carrier protein [Planctomycetes bacterium]|nr:acetyl-CoA carboxylase biotin carboxyl carrier protein [Planctomycetota bacterium]